MTVAIEFQGVSKYFGKDVAAIDDFSLSIEPGEFLTLLGPSGCGKTTLLRCLAGLETPDRGTITVGGKIFSDGEQGVFTPPGDRNLGLVFQSYALWPHMTVAQNIAFGLEVRRFKRPDIAERVEAVLNEMRLKGMGNRYPGELSGGQQQRVALARMLATRPPVYLLDEPLSNLDARLRTDMRAELKHLHHSTGATVIYVTHDQLEALTMSTRIAVLDAGRLQQVAAPMEIYRAPANLFVADFVGYPSINTIEGQVEGRELRFGPFRVPAANGFDGRRVVAAIRPEDLKVCERAEPEAVEFTAYAVLPAGAEQFVDARIGDLSISVRQTHGVPVEMGGPVWLRVPPERLITYDTATRLLLSGVVETA